MKYLSNILYCNFLPYKSAISFNTSLPSAFINNIYFIYYYYLSPHSYINYYTKNTNYFSSIYLQYNRFIYLYNIYKGIDIAL